MPATTRIVDVIWSRGHDIAQIYAIPQFARHYRLYSYRSMYIVVWNGVCKTRVVALGLGARVPANHTAPDRVCVAKRRIGRRLSLSSGVFRCSGEHC